MKIKVKSQIIDSKNVLVACNPDSQKAIDGLKVSAELTMKKERSNPYHRRFFAMLNVAYAYWKPVHNNKFEQKADRFLVESGLSNSEQVCQMFSSIFKKELAKPDEVVKSFDQFRADMTILAGYSEVLYRVGGGEVIMAKSIAFSKMSHDEFHELYGKVKDVIYKYVLNNLSEQDKINFENEIMEF